MKIRILLMATLGLRIVFAQAQPDTVALPYTQYFNEIDFPVGWSQQHDNTITADDWSVSDFNNAGGSPNEMYANWDFGYGNSRLVTPPLMTAGANGLTLSFRHFMSDYFFGTDFCIQSSSDGVNWTDENWTASSGSGDLGPELVSTTINHNLGNITYIAFVIKGDHFQFWYWNIDNVEINVLSSAPECTTTVYPQMESTSVPTNCDLKWTSVSGATDYVVFLGTDNPPTNILNGISTNGTNVHRVYNLQPETQYYWKVVPTNSYGQSSGCPVWSFTTLSPYPLPFTEPLNSLNLPYAWIEKDSAVIQGWHVYAGNFARGTPNELSFVSIAETGTSRYISPPIQTAGMSILTMKFKTRFSGNMPGMTMRVQTSTDGISWANTDFVHSSGNGNLGPVEISIPLDPNQAGYLYFSFVLVGDLSSFDYWVIDDIEITDGGFSGSISGTITYDKASAPPLSNVTIFLKQNNSVIDSAITGNTGEFLFSSVVPGNYTLSYSYAHPWGGGNSVDALLTMKHFAGLAQLTGVRLKAADINNSGNINSVDALLIMKRFVMIINSFVTGDWCFSLSTVAVPLNGNIIIPIKAVCFGDVDGSYSPAK